MKIKKKFQIFILFLLIINSLVIPIHHLSANDEIEWTTIEQATLKQMSFAQTAGLYSGQFLPNRIIGSINIVLTLVGLIFLIMIIYSGFQWMTSGGNEELIKKARGRLINASIGLGVVLGAWVIANTIMLIVRGEPLDQYYF